jgi:hypothetical protein
MSTDVPGGAPLAGLTVLDLTLALAEPFATFLLAGLGRESSRSSTRTRPIRTAHHVDQPVNNISATTIFGADLLQFGSVPLRNSFYAGASEMQSPAGHREDNVRFRRFATAS